MKIKMAMIGIALSGLVATSAAQVPEAGYEDEHTAYTGPVSSMDASATNAVLTKLLKTKKIQGAVVAVAAAVVEEAVDLIGEVEVSIESPSTDVLFDVAK